MQSHLYLNLGCGRYFSSSHEWINIDIAPVDINHIYQYHLLLGIPFADNSFNGVYHSHILEHFPREQVLPFLRECLRVLRPGGILRIAVPDLENILRNYLAVLDAARREETGALDRLLWMQTELCDRMTRQHSGGLMISAWQRADENLTAFIRSRVGSELDCIPRNSQPSPLSLPEQPLALPILNRDFLLSGERHQWMYDNVSLTALLKDAGFVNIKTCSCNTTNFGGFQPDCSEQGTPRKPDSFYIEAQKNPGKIQYPSVALFTTTDLGGAGIATLRLHNGLRQIEIPSVTYVQYKAGTHNYTYVLPPSQTDSILPDGHGGAFLASRTKDSRRLTQALAQWPNRPAGCEAFSISDASPRLRDVPLLDQMEIFHLHWIAGFLDIPANTDFLKNKKIVWTLHDMNPFTGGCHYAGNCSGYMKQCGSCPQLGSNKDYDLSRCTWKKRNYTYRNLDITIVTPSRWLADEVRKSTLMGKFPIHCIPNGIPMNVFKPYSKTSVRDTLGIPHEESVLLFSADNILNKRKGLQYLIEALLLLRKKVGQKNITLLLLGSGGEQIHKLPFTVRALGNLSSSLAMAAAYSAADAIVLPSLEDNLPNVLIEAQACGTPAVAFNIGGIPEIIEHGKTGWLAQAQNTEELSDGLLWALTPNPARSLLCRSHALEHYSLSTCAKAYESLYNSLLS